VKSTDQFPKFLYMYATVVNSVRNKHFGNRDLTLEEIKAKFQEKNVREKFFREAVPQEHIKLTKLRNGARGLFNSSGEFYTSFNKSLRELPEELKRQAVRAYITPPP
jgi:hypothetical protein